MKSINFGRWGFQLSSWPSPWSRMKCQSSLVRLGQWHTKQQYWFDSSQTRLVSLRPDSNRIWLFLFHSSATNQARKLAGRPSEVIRCWLIHWPTGRRARPGSHVLHVSTPVRAISGARARCRNVLEMYGWTINVSDLSAAGTGGTNRWDAEQLLELDIVWRESVEAGKTTITGTM